MSPKVRSKRNKFAIAQKWERIHRADKRRNPGFAIVLRVTSMRVGDVVLGPGVCMIR